MAKGKIFGHILKERHKETGEFRYSQGRIYLFISVLAYFLTLGVITYKSLRPNSDIDVNVTKVIIEALQYAMVLFGGYVFGGKFLDAAKIVFGNNNKKEEAQG